MPWGQLERMALRQAEMTGSGKRRKRMRSSMWRERDAKRVWKGGTGVEEEAA